LHAIFGITRGTPFTVQKALPLLNVFADFTNRCVTGLDGSEAVARGNLGGPRQCLRVDILPDVRQFAISNSDVEDPMVLERPVRGLDSPCSEADDQNPVSLRYELGGIRVGSFHRFVSLLK
jgi:hypothetical protein